MPRLFFATDFRRSPETAARVIMDFGALAIRDLVLYESQTLPTGVRYAELAACALSS